MTLQGSKLLAIVSQLTIRQMLEQQKVVSLSRECPPSAAFAELSRGGILSNAAKPRI